MNNAGYPLPAREAPARLRVLLINDTAKKLGRLHSALLEAGFAVIDASGPGIDLPEQVAAIRPDVVLIDSQSPGRDVLEHVVQITREQPRPIVLFTDEHDPQVMRQAIQLRRQRLHRRRHPGRAPAADPRRGHGALCQRPGAARRAAGPRGATGRAQADRTGQGPADGHEAVQRRTGLHADAPPGHGPPAEADPGRRTGDRHARTARPSQPTLTGKPCAALAHGFRPPAHGQATDARHSSQPQSQLIVSQGINCHSKNWQAVCFATDDLTRHANGGGAANHEQRRSSDHPPRGSSAAPFFIASKRNSSMSERDSTRRTFLKQSIAVAGVTGLGLAVPGFLRSSAWAAGSDAPEKTDLKIGFIPLTDCASVVVAATQGFGKQVRADHHPEQGSLLGRRARQARHRRAGCRPCAVRHDVRRPVGRGRPAEGHGRAHGPEPERPGHHPLQAVARRRRDQRRATGRPCEAVRHAADLRTDLPHRHPRHVAVLLAGRATASTRSPT